MPLSSVKRGIVVDSVTGSRNSEIKHCPNFINISHKSCRNNYDHKIFTLIHNENAYYIFPSCSLLFKLLIRERCGSYFASAFPRLILLIDIFSTYWEIGLDWVPQNPIDDKCSTFTFIQVMFCCLQATIHYMGQCWPRVMSLYDIGRLKWVYCYKYKIFRINLSHTIATFRLNNLG